MLVEDMATTALAVEKALIQHVTRIFFNGQVI